MPHIHESRQKSVDRKCAVKIRCYQNRHVEFLEFLEIPHSYYVSVGGGDEI